MLPCVHNAGMGTFGLDGLTQCVYSGGLFQLICVHNVDMETFDLHGLILCVSEDVHFVMFCNYTVGMNNSFDLHGLT